MLLSRCHDFVPVTGWSIYLEVAGSSPSHAILYVVNFVRPLILWPPVSISLYQVLMLVTTCRIASHPGTRMANML